MKTQTIAQALVTSENIHTICVDNLWEEVECVMRLDEGGDIYTYADGSQIKVLGSSVTVL